MTAKIRAALQQYEQLTEAGAITTFDVYIIGEGILIKAQGEEAGLKVPLIEEVLVSLHAYFYEVDCIEYGSFDYATLKDYINAAPQKDGVKE